MIAKPIFVVLIAGLTATSAASQDLQDVHLPVVPRTAEEAARIARVTALADDFTQASQFEERSAGAATVRAMNNADAFSQPSANISFEGELNFKVGNGFFRKLWVSAPSSTLGSDGLGPLYNARSCQRCHLKDGRGHPPEGPEDSLVSIAMKLSVPAPENEIAAQIEGYLARTGDPVYGGQFQDLALPGHAAEGRVKITYEEHEVPLSGGEVAYLRAPTYDLTQLGYGPLANDVAISPRVAPQMIGLGLIEAIPAADILALADPEDANADGISGRPSVVWSLEYERPMLGRFGLKAARPTVREQSAGAFAADIGISTPLFPDAWGDCTKAQQDCHAAPHGDGDDRVFEVDDTFLDLTTFYSRNLAVPARRDVNDVQVLRGKQIFYETGCTACHQPSFVTHRLDGQPEQSFQLIWPYSDFLLHDMGEGLADGMPEGLASGREWRTPPLWGIGMTQRVSGHTYFLHDGRARSLLEAVLWHGGEAQAQRDAVTEMPPKDRAALIRFLESL